MVASNYLLILYSCDFLLDFSIKSWLKADEDAVVLDVEEVIAVVVVVDHVVAVSVMRKRTGKLVQGPKVEI